MLLGLQFVVSQRAGYFHAAAQEVDHNKFGGAGQQEEENGKTTFVAPNGELFGSSKEAPWAVKKGTHEINKTDYS